MVFLIHPTMDWQGLWARLQPEDFRILNPLLYGHINPYGLFGLDLGARRSWKRRVCSFPYEDFIAPSLPEPLMGKGFSNTLLTQGAIPFCTTGRVRRNSRTGATRLESKQMLIAKSA